MRVRDARPGDGRRIEEIRIRGWQVAYAGLIDAAWLSDLTVTDERVDTWEQRIAQPDDGATLLVAEDDGDLLGWAGLLPAHDEDAAGAYELLGLYVDPDRRFTGVGSALLPAGFARTTAVEHVLWVLAGNAPARRFYTRHGFAPDGAEKVLDVPGQPLEVRLRRTAQAVAATNDV